MPLKMVQKRDIFDERTRECHRSIAKHYKNAIKIECLFDGFADVAVTGPDTRHQDLLSSFTLVFSGFLRIHLEHDLKEVSDVSQELDPAVENGPLEDYYPGTCPK